MNFLPTVQIKSRSKTLIIAVGLWLSLSALQSIHFYFYFEQSLWDSVRWSFRDWLVWFVIFAVLHVLFQRRAELTEISAKNILIVAAIAVASGVLQVAVITSLDFIAGTASRPFWDDFRHFYSKRWLQYFFIFSVFWLFMMWRVSSNRPTQTDTQIHGRTLLRDGRDSYWLKSDEVIKAQAEGNYVSIHTPERELLIRSTLKNLMTQLRSSSIVRVSRSSLINMQCVVSCKKIGGRTAVLVLSDGSEIKVGPSYWPELSQHLKLEEFHHK